MSALIIDGLLRYHRTMRGRGGIALLASSRESVRPSPPWSRLAS